MTLLNSDRERRSSQMTEWTENLSRRSVVSPVLIAVGRLIGGGLVTSFLVK